MKNKILSAVLAAVSLIPTSCDEGRIFNVDSIQAEEGGIVVFSGEIAGIETWSEGYTIALAGFAEGNDYAVISKNIAASVSEGRCDVSLSGIPSEVTVIELCAIDRLRRRIATFLSVGYTPQGSPIEIGSEGIDVSMSGAIQREIFTSTCVQCHGGAGYAAAGLSLMAGDSFSNLIGVPSRKMPGLDRVAPGKSAESELFQILSTNASADWNYDHSVEVVRQEKLDLIRNWIDNGAKVAYMK